jgi:hypothetical protein
VIFRNGLMAVLMSYLLAAGCSPASPPAASRHSGALQAVQPKGSTPWPITFTWSGAEADGLVRVRVYDEAERQIYGIEARGNTVAAPDDLRRSLDTGKSYLWRVARVDENGAEVDESSLTTFTLR